MPEVSNIYDQSIELGDVSYLVYSMASLYQVLQEKEEFSSNRESETWYFPDVLKVVNKYKKELEESKYKENFFGKQAKDSFSRLSEWAKENEPEHAKDIYMTHINVKNMKNEMVYGVLVDKVHKRIVVVFRGTESFAGGTGMYHNIMSDITVVKTKEDLPPSVAGKPEGGIEHVWLHTGFHNYFNKKTSNDNEFTPKQQMLLYVKEEIENHPDYTICCTGHSLGASLSTLGAYYLALDEEIPKPVNNINFQSPRLGDSNFLKACRYLEEKGDLQICRYSNDNDLIANSPSVNYFHVGIEIRMPKNAQKNSLTITYPRANVSTFSWEWAGSLWRGSFLANFNFSYDHGDYVDRLKDHKKELEDMKTLREMYQNTELTGFSKN